MARRSKASARKKAPARKRATGATAPGPRAVRRPKGAPAAKPPPAAPAGAHEQHPDVRAIQGLWRFLRVERPEGEAPMSCGWTHLLFEGETLREVDVHRVAYEDEHAARSVFELAPGATPARIVQRTTFFDKKGSPIETRAYLSVYRLEGDTLRLVPGYGQFPASVDTNGGDVFVYARESYPDVLARHGGPPRAVERTTLEHPLLGRLRWDANDGTWSGVRTLARRKHEVSIPGDERVAAADLDRAAAKVRAVEDRLADLAGFAADRLLELRNEEWREGGERPVSRDAFVKRLRVETIDVAASGRVEVFFSDGGLFRGHSVIVSLDARLRPVDATI